MNLQGRMAKALDRLATGSSVLRVRHDEHEHEANHGGVPDRLEQVIERLEQAADDLWEELKLN